MLALALETSGRTGSVAILRDDHALAERTFPHGLQHAAGLIPLLDAALRDHGLRIRDVTNLFLSIGPGSFTGLRIAVTVAKTLAFATGVRITPVPTPRVLVENLSDARDALVLLDARRGSVYAARYRRGPDAEWMEVEAARLDRAADALARAPGPIWLTGEGIAYHREHIPDAADVWIAPEEAWHGRAAALATIARPLALRGQYADPDTLAPLYLRAPEAQEKWDAMQAMPPAAG